jgi:hypothetical protein
MIMTRSFLIIVFILTCCPIMAQPIDEKMMKAVDLTGDGRPEKIILTIKAEDISKPVRWSLTILSADKVLLRHSRDDSKIDSFFEDSGYVVDCTGYAECKRKWYYKDILNSLIVPANRYNLEGVLDKKQTNTLYPVGRAYLAECCGIGPKQADPILAKIEKRIRSGKAVMITIPDTPVTNGILLTFCAEVGRFIPVYKD